MFEIDVDFGLVPTPLKNGGWSKTMPITERTMIGMLYGNNFCDTLDHDQALIFQKDRERAITYAIYRNPEDVTDEPEYWIIIHHQYK